VKEYVMRTRILVVTVLLTGLFVVPAPAFAEDPAALVVDATHIAAKRGVHAGANGAGVELRFAPDDEAITGSIGGFAAVGERGDVMRRDVLDVHFQFGIKAKKTAIAPYVGLGLDVLHVTTHVDAMTYRGTTLGISAQVGLLGRIGEHTVFRATAGYMGAIVPGTGDDLGAVVLQLGVGYAADH